MVVSGETMIGLKFKPRGAPVSTELASDPAAMSLAEIGPAKVLERRKGQMCPRVARHGGRRPHSRRCG